MFLCQIYFIVIQFCLHQKPIPFYQFLLGSWLSKNDCIFDCPLKCFVVVLLIWLFFSIIVRHVYCSALRSIWGSCIEIFFSHRIGHAWLGLIIIIKNIMCSVTYIQRLILLHPKTVFLALLHIATRSLGTSLP